MQSRRPNLEHAGRSLQGRWVEISAGEWGPDISLPRGIGDPSRQAGRRAWCRLETGPGWRPSPEVDGAKNGHPTSHFRPVPALSLTAEESDGAQKFSTMAVENSGDNLWTNSLPMASLEAWYLAGGAG